MYSSGVTGKGGPSSLSLLASTGNMSVASCPPGLISVLYRCAHAFLSLGCSAHKNLQHHESCVSTPPGGKRQADADTAGGLSYNQQPIAQDGNAKNGGF